VRAAVLQAPKTPFEVRDVMIDRPGPREVLVRIAASSLCHSDYHFANGDLPAQMPIILGHEAAGVVEMVGSDVTTVSVGDHVVGCAASFCGECSRCSVGLNHLCSSKPKRAATEPSRLAFKAEPVHQGSLLGGFAEQMLVHENAVVHVPRALPLDRAALLGCGVLTGLGTVMNMASVSPGSRVAVVGCGGVGLNVIQGAKLAGAGQIIAVDLVPEKQGLANEFGATDFVVAGTDVVEVVRELSHGGVDFSFEVIGLPKTMEQAVRMLAPRGVMTMIGSMSAEGTITLPANMTRHNEWRVQGAYMGSSPFTREIPRYAELYLSGKLNLDLLISKRIGLHEVNAGFDAMLSGREARSVIVFDDVLTEANRRA
jgi:S-(hydroxymethyl)glutathione dehydrogenase/alcohol dehydrogenase